VLLTLLTAAGGIASAGIFQPAMAMLSSGVSVALQGVVLPVILTGGVMGVLNNITGRVQLGQFFKLSKTVAKWMIGFLFTLYFGITTAGHDGRIL
jgi:stage III sporulation protein AE